MKRFWAILGAVLLLTVVSVGSGWTSVLAEALELEFFPGEISGGDTRGGDRDVIDTMDSFEDDFYEEDSMEAWVEEAGAALEEVTADHVVMAVVYLTTGYEVRSEADSESSAVVTVSSGQTVQIVGVAMDEDYDVWEAVTFYYNGTEYSGYIQRSYLACSDELFLEWEEAYGMNPASWTMAVMAIAEDDTETVYEDIEQFPESYQAVLTALKEEHPNWIFVAMDTGLDWEDVVTNEMTAGRSLIETSFPSYMWSEAYSSSWGYATQAALEYYLDPRNGLTETGIFQFEQLTYNASYHTEDAVQLILDNTFMSGTMPLSDMTYAEAFWEIGSSLGVSPFHLACRVYQEQGAGTSPLISGTYEGYEGYYNYFNIGASGSTDTAVYTSGLTYAMNKGWSTPYLSILGGAETISANYILKGQDTIYLQKFDVDSSYNGLYWHQYMQNIVAPTSEAKNIYKAYQSADALDNTFVFKIPVYDNMPEEACSYPSAYTVMLDQLDGYTDAVVYLDGVAYEATGNAGMYYVEASDKEAKIATMYSYNESGVPTGMAVWELSNDGSSYTAVQIDGLTDLLSYHGFSIRITGKSGIRVKTGISSTVRAQLLGDGVEGYTLKEYGTLVMTESNYATYPLVLGGTKVSNAVSYGTNSSGAKVDNVYETVNGRYRYTMVFVGLPVAQYKTVFAFRGYAVLTKDGEDVTVYGPVVTNSIYSLSQRLLDSGSYSEDSAVYQFLQQLIADADALDAAETLVSSNDAD